MENKRATIIVPNSLYTQILATAKDEERSFNKQVIALLKKAIGDQITRTGEGGEKKGCPGTIL
ncbi:MAG: hypothetical protein HZB37_11945 [Planctomycetes bacterium]|nr:hypothetical protein [Planctomycetota bacterium]